jgi:hypothetical protein
VNLAHLFFFLSRYGFFLFPVVCVDRRVVSIIM